jgi:hypothetical protein
MICKYISKYLIPIVIRALRIKNIRHHYTFATLGKIIRLITPNVDRDVKQSSQNSGKVLWYKHSEKPFGSLFF